MKQVRQYILALGLLFVTAPLFAQKTVDTLTLSSLHLDRKDSKSFSGRDSSLVLKIDTLLMGDRSRILFHGKKQVDLYVQHAVIGERVLIRGTDGKNNGTHINLYIGIQRLGDLTIDAAGEDAMNGTKTYPNGNGGNIHVYYAQSGLKPQNASSDLPQYILMKVEGGGKHVNAQSDVGNIVGRISSGNRPLGQLPQGQVYSGSPGLSGEAQMEAIDQIP